MSDVMTTRLDSPVGYSGIYGDFLASAIRLHTRFKCKADVIRMQDLMSY